MKVLGIDPGSIVTGYGVVELLGNKLKYIDSGVIRTKEKTFIKRLIIIFSEIEKLMDQHCPDEVAIEEPFASRNIRTAIAIGQAQAVAMVAAAQHELPISRYAPRRVNQSVTDHGGSSKIQVQIARKSEFLNIQIYFRQTLKQFIF